MVERNRHAKRTGEGAVVLDAAPGRTLRRNRQTRRSDAAESVRRLRRSGLHANIRDGRCKSRPARISKKRSLGAADKGTHEASRVLDLLLWDSYFGRE